MRKIEKVVFDETKYITAWVLIFSAIMQAVFLVIGHWDYTVLLGNLLCGSVVVLNFFAMAYTVQIALEKEERDAKNTMKLSLSLRMLFLFVVVLLGITLPCFNIWSSIIPLFFPRIAIMFRRFFDKNNNR